MPNWSIELSIRAAQLAKASLELLGVKDKTLAMLHLQEIAGQLKELVEFIHDPKTGG